jgi:hypothetical protein
MKFFIISILLFPLFLKADESVLVTSVQKNSPDSRKAPSIYCLVDEKKKYEGFSYRMNGKNLYFDSILSLNVNDIFKIQGTWKKDLTTKIKEIGACEEELTMEQLRSDWFAEENGDSEFGTISWSVGGTNRNRLKELSYFHVAKIEKFDVFQCSYKDKFLRLNIRKLKELDGVPLSLISHYEGGRGKPMPTYKKQEIKLKKNENYFHIPLSVKDESREVDSLLHGVKIEGKKANFSINVEVNLESCKKYDRNPPKDKRK